MNTSLRNHLRRKMDEMDISAHKLEQKAGLRPSAVQNILYGRSRKPSAAILLAIAKVLGCSMTELMGEPEKTPPTQTTTNKNIPFNSFLYLKSAETAQKIISARKIKALQSPTIQYIGEIYSYAVENKMKNVDENFAQWLATRYWETNI